VDANIILRYLLADNKELTAQADAVLQAVADGEVTAECDPVTLAEVVFVLSSKYKMPNGEIAEGLISLFTREGLQMTNKQRYLHALELFAGPVKHFGDACACAAALEQTEGRLFSFDRKLSSVPGITRSQNLTSPGKLGEQETGK
jgi:predicted nucleic-acid-binding protein